MRLRTGSIRSLQTTSYHSSFTGRLLGITVAFERRLAEAGVELLNTASAPPADARQARALPPHAQGVARRRGPSGGPRAPQLLLDCFRSHCNEERPHQRSATRPRPSATHPGRREPGASASAGSPSRQRSATTRRIRSCAKCGATDGLAITLAKRYADAVVRIVEVGELIRLYLGDELIRALAPDRRKRCQKLGKRASRRH